MLGSFVLEVLMITLLYRLSPVAAIKQKKP
jgi:hypothetical protein